MLKRRTDLALEAKELWTESAEKAAGKGVFGLSGRIL